MEKQEFLLDLEVPDIVSVRQPDHYVFDFGGFRVRGARHMATRLTIHRSGAWECQSRVKTRFMSFVPQIELMMKFHKQGTSRQVPIGRTPKDWAPLMLWKQTFGRNDYQLVKKSGQSEFIRHYFDVIASDSEASLHMHVSPQKGIMALFKS